jgi:hypothetical protein
MSGLIVSRLSLDYLPLRNDRVTRWVVPTAGGRLWPRFILRCLDRSAVLHCPRVIGLSNERAWFSIASASLAVLADAGAPSQTQGSKRGRPETGDLRAEPALHVGWRFNLERHGVDVLQSTHTVKRKPLSYDSTMYYASCDRDELNQSRLASDGPASVVSLQAPHF